MKVKPILSPLPGERVVHVHPPLQLNVDATWQRRLHFYTGRSLSDIALSAEQSGRAGRLAMRGQMVSPGVVQGLELALGTEATNGGTARYYHLAAGLGVAASGEDVVVPVAQHVNVRALPVYAPPSVLAGEPESESNVLGQLRARRLGPSLGALIDAAVPLPPAGIVVLQPVTNEIIGNFDAADPCEIDPRNDAFLDWQQIDGARLVFYAWPTEWLPLPVPDARWRNRLAQAIFAAEHAAHPRNRRWLGRSPT